MQLLLLALAFVVASAEECQRMCHFNWDPVCGSDGQTYGNMCELTSLACMRKNNVAFSYNGECTPMKTQKMTGCQLMCTMNYDPVCGSDGQTYGNECELTTKACLLRSDLTISFNGECSSQCNQLCHFNWDPVCGSDGQTYGNMCELTSTACLKRADIQPAHMGECSVECNQLCHFNWDPVCGSDGQTYGNTCEFQSTMCMRKQAMSISHMGEC